MIRLTKMAALQNFFTPHEMYAVSNNLFAKTIRSSNNVIIIFICTHIICLLMAVHLPTFPNCMFTSLSKLIFVKDCIDLKVY